MQNIVRVDDAPFSASGGGLISDRAAIQQAIDTVNKLGGGTVVLSAGKTYLSGGIILKSNVELHFEDGAVLLQSPDPHDYVKPVKDGCEPYTPLTGHNYSDKIKWSHVWYKNYPFIFSPEGAHDIAVTGSGRIQMDTVSDENTVMRICPIGFYRVKGVVISDVTIAGYHTYAMMPYTSERILIKNVKIGEWSLGNCDGVCLMNCRDVRITGCDMDTGDDSVYIFSSYRDPRGGEWWSSDEPQPSTHIEIDNNRLVSNRCKAFAIIPWGIDCPELEKTEISDVYVHDNYIQTMGVWLYNPYAVRKDDPPIKNLRLENNKIDAIEKNFFDTAVSGAVGFHSMTALHNGNLRDGDAFWLSSCGEGGFAGVVRPENAGMPLGRIESADGGRAALYQGIYIRNCEKHTFAVRARCDYGKCRVFVRNSDSGELIASLPVDGGEGRYSLSFSVPAPGNCDIGIETDGETSSSAILFSANLCGGDGLPGYSRVENVDDGEKIIYFYKDFKY